MEKTIDLGTYSNMKVWAEKEKNPDKFGVSYNLYTECFMYNNDGTGIRDRVKLKFGTHTVTDFNIPLNKEIGSRSIITNLLHFIRETPYPYKEG